MNFNMENIEQAIHDANKMADTLGLEGNIRHDFFVGLMATMCDASYDLGFAEGHEQAMAKATLDLHRREQELANEKIRLAATANSQHSFNEGHIAGRVREAQAIVDLVKGKQWRGANIANQILSAIDAQRSKIGGAKDPIKYPAKPKQE